MYPAVKEVTPKENYIIAALLECTALGSIQYIGKDVSRASRKRVAQTMPSKSGRVTILMTFPHNFDLFSMVRTRKRQKKIWRLNEKGISKYYFEVASKQNTEPPFFNGAPGAIRTCGLRIRSPFKTLFPCLYILE